MHDFHYFPQGQEETAQLSIEARPNTWLPKTLVSHQLTKHNKTLARLVKLLSLQPRSILQINRAFSVPSIE